ncbi:hypothetical protein [Streptomyces avicenniae]|uniref:hypothetical protein n=1 Tax=Streptomyces avicenniae TaxID=500153 RepID=UPI00167CB869|nr:hypothetical protein [Streptomyces avicenniae]
MTGRRRARGAGAAALVAVLAAGCGGGGDGDLVIEGEAPAAPYAGPLWVEPQDASLFEEDSVEAAEADAGAAALALECDGAFYQGGGAEIWSEGDGGDDPEGGLRAYFSIEMPGLPEYGYRVEREEDGRVLYSFDVGGETKIAVIVAEDGQDRPGWGPETSAACDPAELPDPWTDDQWYEVWTDADGDRVPIAEVNSSEGSEHCGWQRADFIEMGRDPDRSLYARDPQGVLPGEMLTAPYDGDVEMPADARHTGYRLGDRELSLAADGATAYVRTPDGVEAWPLVRPGMGCA